MKDKEETTKFLTLRLPPEKKAEVKIASARLGITMTRFVDQAIEKYIEELKRKRS